MPGPLSQRIFETLSASETLVSIVGNRIYYGVPAQGVSQPLVSFMIDSDMTIGSLEGELSSDTRDASVSLNAWSPDNVEARQIAEHMMVAMDASTQFYCTEFTSREDFDQFDKTYNVEIDAALWWYPGR